MGKTGNASSIQARNKRAAAAARQRSEQQRTKAQQRSAGKKIVSNSPIYAITSNPRLSRSLSQGVMKYNADRERETKMANKAAFHPAFTPATGRPGESTYRAPQPVRRLPAAPKAKPMTESQRLAQLRKDQLAAIAADKKRREKSAKQAGVVKNLWQTGRLAGRVAGTVNTELKPINLALQGIELLYKTAKNLKPRSRSSIEAEKDRQREIADYNRRHESIRDVAGRLGHPAFQSKYKISPYNRAIMQGKNPVSVGGRIDNLVTPQDIRNAQKRERNQRQTR